MEEKPNCYKCIHRRNVPGDAHSRCAHPAYEDETFALCLAAMHCIGGAVYPQPADIAVTGHPHGIAMGWFMHPINFDPVWLVSCTGYEEQKDEPTG